MVEQKIAERPGDQFAIIEFEALYHMRMMTNHQARARIHGPFEFGFNRQGRLLDIFEPAMKLQDRDAAT